MRAIFARVPELSSEFERCHSLSANRMIAILLLAEDRRARWHLGVDLLSILRALWVARSTGRINAVSTIEQQLVRTLRPRRRSPLRSKPLELALSVILALRHRKRTIWGAYLSCAYFGSDWDSLAEVVADLSPGGSPLSVEATCKLIAYLKYPAPDLPSQKHSMLHRRRTQYLLSAYRLTAHDRGRTS